MRRPCSEDTLSQFWALELQPEPLFAYELRRPGRFFRVEFDLTRAAPGRESNPPVEEQAP